VGWGRWGSGQGSQHTPALTFDSSLVQAVGGSWLGFEFDEPVQVNEVELAQAGVSCQQVENIWLEYLSMEDGRWLKAANLTVPMPNGRISVEELSSEAAAVDPAEGKYVPILPCMFDAVAPGIAADMRPGCEECAQLLGKSTAIICKPSSICAQTQTTMALSAKKNVKWPSAQ
jgi:hypothetical protein